MSSIPGTWSETQVAGHPCDVYEPPQPSPHGFVVVYLHGVHLNRLVENAAFSAEFARHGLRVIAPLTQRSWWTNRICTEFDPQLTAERHLLDNVLPEIERRWDTKPTQIALLGTSMGGQGALRFAFKYPALFPVVAGISPAIDYYTRMEEEGDETLWEMYDDPEQARQDTATLHVHPLNWPRHLFYCCDPADERWHESAERLTTKLAALGIPFTCDLDTTGGGHGFEYYNRMAPKAVGFIAEQLERERLRVV
ncbi:MAG: prolyl oligopeptidase family serine peptidase [Pirellulales bacterium]|nr:prolyl oligopeptidase family serine peptidase [Pirellulales bacterium]